MIFTVLLIAHLIGSYIASYVLDYPYFDFTNRTVQNIQDDGFIWYYIKPYTRIGPYLIGLLFAELFQEIPERKKQEKKVGNEDDNELKEEEDKPTLFKRVNIYLINRPNLSYVLFAIALIFLNYAYFINNLPNKVQLPNAVAALFNSLNKNLFVIGLGIILHLTFLNYFSFVKDFLSLSVFTPVARITYGIYLFHLNIIIIYVLSNATNIYFNFLETSFVGIGIFMLTIPFSLVTTALFESPFVNLLKMFFG